MKRILLIDVDGFALLQFRGPLIGRLVESGVQVDVASGGFRDIDHRRLLALGCRVHELPLQRTGLNPLRDRAAKEAIRGLIATTRPEVMVARAGKAVAYALPIAERLVVPRRIGFMTGLGTMFYPESIRERLLGPLGRSLMVKGLRSASEIWTLNEDNGRLLESLGANAGGAPVHCMDSDGVDGGRFRPREFPRAITFGFVGRLMRSKGFDLFMEAAAAVHARRPEVRFVVAGESDRRGGRGSAALSTRHSGEDWITFKGFVEDLPALLGDITCLVLPSYHEGRPRSVLEALSSGRPVVVSDAVGCHDVIEHGSQGLVVPVGDAGALAEALLGLARDPERCRRMGTSARTLAEGRYSERTVVDRYMDRLLGSS